MKKIVDWSIDHRLFVTLFGLLFFLFGLFAWLHLSIDAVPDLTNQQVQINTLVEGLTPEEVEKKVTLPIETALKGIEGLEGTRSLSRHGFSQVTALFEDHVDLYFARQQILTKLLEVHEELPVSAEPVMGAVTTGLGEVYMWSVEFNDSSLLSTPGWQKDGTFLTPEGERLTTPLEQQSYLRELQDWVIRPYLKGVTGVADIDVIGGYEKQIELTLDVEAMWTLNVSLEDIEEAVKNNQEAVGAGHLFQQGEALLVQANGKLEHPFQIEQIVIKKEKGRPILIGDVATVGLGKEVRTGVGTKNGEEAVLGTAMMLIGGNSRVVAKRVDTAIKELQKRMPPGVHIVPLLDRTQLIDQTIQTVESNLLEGALLVVIILFLFLKHVRASLVVASVIPLAMCLCFIVMYRMNMSGNLMSLGAIDFGLIVDGAVIIVENSLRRLKERQEKTGEELSTEERVLEVKQAAHEMIRPSVYGQAIIMLVYFPLFMLTGVEGKMFHPMASTVLLALFSAFCLSLTWIPALCALVISVTKEKNEPWMDRCKNVYRHLLQKLLLSPQSSLVFSVTLFACAYLVFMGLGQEFVPTLDEHNLAIQVTRLPSTSIDQALAMQKEVEKRVLEVDEVAVVFSKTGTAEMATDPMPPDASDTFVMLKPRSAWKNPKLSKEELIESFEEALGVLKGNQFEFSQPIEMRFNELIGGVKSDVAIRLFGQEFEVLTSKAKEIAHKLHHIQGAQDIVVEPVDGLSSVQFVFDEKRIQQLGASKQQLMETLSACLGGKCIANLQKKDRSFPIFLRLGEKERNDPRKLSLLPIPYQEGAFLPLKAFGGFATSSGMHQISHVDGKRAVMVEANVRGRDLGSFIEEAQREMEKISLPAEYWMRFGGQFEHLTKALETLLLILPAAFFFIWLLLYHCLASAKVASVVFMTVPLAMTGGVLALFVCSLPFSISAFIGLIALSGIAVLNGLVLVTSIQALQKRGYAFKEAVIQGCLLRVRPVLMTATVASVGFLPMALATGAGSEVQKPLAIVVIGGIVSATVLTLLLLPVLYYAVLQNEQHIDLET